MATSPPKVMLEVGAYMEVQEKTAQILVEMASQHDTEANQIVDGSFAGQVLVNSTELGVEERSHPLNSSPYPSAYAISANGNSTANTPLEFLAEMAHFTDYLQPDVRLEGEVKTEASESVSVNSADQVLIESNDLVLEESPNSSPSHPSYAICSTPIPSNSKDPNTNVKFKITIRFKSIQAAAEMKKADQKFG